MEDKLEKKMCPLFKLAYFAGTINNNPDVACLEEDCAWWDKARGRCCILSLVSSLDNLTEIIIRKE